MEIKKELQELAAKILATQERVKTEAHTIEKYDPSTIKETV